MAGQALFGLGGLLIIVGLIGRAGMLAVNAVRAKGKLPALGGLRDAYPTLPVWFVPESAFGYIVAGLLAALGIYVVLTAKTMLKARKPRTGRR
jgi:hypothetical protein